MFDWLYLAVLLVVAVVIILLALRKKSTVAWVLAAQNPVFRAASTQATTAPRGDGQVVKKKKLFALTLPLLFCIFVVLLYGQWGGWSSWQHYQEKQAKAEHVQEILKQFKTSTALIQKLKQKLNDTPESARGWYLLGRLYASQNDWHAAHDSFQKAIRLDPSHERYLMNDIYAQWMINQRQLNAEIRKNLQSLLQKNPKQPDALAMLAMDAYQQKNYHQAITYWQVLLSLAPPDSEAAGALRKAIAKAQRKLILN